MFMATKQEEELDRIIDDEHLAPEASRAFLETAFRDGVVRETGTAIKKILPPISLFTPRAVVRRRSRPY
jgi:type I restriction enzyme, R subunit